MVDVASGSSNEHAQRDGRLSRGVRIVYIRRMLTGSSSLDAAVLIASGLLDKDYFAGKLV